MLLYMQYELLHYWTDNIRIAICVEVQQSTPQQLLVLGHRTPMVVGRLPFSNRTNLITQTPLLMFKKLFQNFQLFCTIKIMQ